MQTPEGDISTVFPRLSRGRAIDFSSDGFIRDSAEAMQKLDQGDPASQSCRNRLNAHLKRNKQSLDRESNQERLIMVTDLNREK